MDRGVPSYHPKYCDKLKELQKQGKSQIEFCAEIEITYKTYLVWQEKFEDFGNASELAEVFALAWWLNLGQYGVNNPRFNEKAYTRQVINRFPKFFTEKGRRIHLKKLQDALNNGENSFGQCTAVLKELSNAELTAEECLATINSIHMTAQTKKVDELDDLVSEITEKHKKEKK